jgi:hypothetical protein
VESFIVGLHMIRVTGQVTFVQERLTNLFQDAEELRPFDPRRATTS